ncbi:phosphate ABC transporter substrate-binding protein [Ketobacter sp.]|uniref:phosphate ABC transporter substrate-binding protein n=1 Tax=Ketobacter sp. TaxID=2083498 RepID=UPI0025C0B7BA|nr:phosphate ABC transporter substrate-binding protein [Ketobacter sp.]
MNRLNRIKAMAAGITLALLSNIAFSDVAVIVNPGNDAQLEADDIAKIYLGKMKRFSNGNLAIPLDRTEGSDIRIKFLESTVGKDETKMKSYWSRLIFTGKGVPPKIVESGQEVKELVSRNPDIIGYIDSSEVDDSVKVIATF